MQRVLAVTMLALVCAGCAQSGGRKSQDAASSARLGELEATMSRFQEQQRLRDAELDMRLRDIADRLDRLSSGKAPAHKSAKVQEAAAPQATVRTVSGRQPLVAGQVIPYASLAQGAPQQAPAAAPTPAPAPASMSQPQPLTPPPASHVSAPQAGPQPQPLALKPPVVSLDDGAASRPASNTVAPAAPAQPRQPVPMDQSAAKPAKAPAPMPAGAAPAAAPSVSAKPAASPGMEEQTLYTDALRAVSANKSEEGRRKFNDFLAKYPNSPKAPEALYWIGESYIADKSYNQAILSLKEVTVRFPSDPKAEEALYRIAEAYERLGDKSNAVFHLKLLVDEHPKSDFAAKAKQKLKQLGQ
ncbi:tetratricopeptide repeat protein [Fundidesulfovibrio soli]|uniref:tetratricopeptide repeat protein n=1 Tax=Fundidesulfovibrio soli TaxID=2922716 RepID=UPI001FAFA569|nr:tetratricopeptide repeat protein [Fundidesulfovibrio soli]